MSDANKVLKQMKENGAKYLDLRFTDPRGKLQHLTMDGTAVDEDLLNDEHILMAHRSQDGKQ